MTALPLLLGLAGATVLTVRTETVDSRPAVRVLAAGELGEVAVRREGPEVVLSMAAEAPGALATPSVAAPLEAIRIVNAPPGVAVRVRISTKIPYEVRREGSLVTLLFGERPEEKPSPDTAELYKQLFPVSPSEQQPAVEQPLVGDDLTPEGEESWLRLGPLRLRPSVITTYVQAETSLLDSPEPVRDTYLEVQPRIASEVSLGNGRLRATYEPRFRSHSTYPQLEKASHNVDASLDLPVGPRLVLRATDHYARGLLETQEVDPGGEYFFQLGRFRRNQAGATARLELTPRLTLEAGGVLNQVRFEEPGSFFDYEMRSGLAGLGFELTANTRLELGYVRDEVPTPRERPTAASEADGVQLRLSGEVLPLVRAEIGVGYRDQRSPAAAEGGRRYRGLVAQAALRKEFTRAATLELGARRTTPLSAFEENAFYVATATEAHFTLPLPLAFYLRASTGYHWNDYRTVAAGLDGPRRDRIFGWSVGLARPVTRWAYLRADYRWDRRDSNLDFFDNESEVLNLQVGIGLLNSRR